MKGIDNFSINKKNRNLRKFLIGVIFLSIIILILNFLSGPIKNSLYAISSPIQKTFWTAGESSSGFLGSFFKAGSLISENEKLKTENQRLLYQVAFLSSVGEGTQAQKEVSLSCQNNSLKFVMAGVIGLDNNDVISINKGQDDGISEGMPVISQQNVLLGKVIKVYKDFSKIMLISNKDSVVNVKVQQLVAPENKTENISEVDGVVKGLGGLNAYLDLVPIDNEINTDEVLVTSSIEGSFPKDLLVGRIVQKEKNDQEPFQQAKISLFFDIKKIDNLFVITNYKQPN